MSLNKEPACQVVFDTESHYHEEIPLFGASARLSIVERVLSMDHKRAEWHYYRSGWVYAGLGTALWHRASKPNSVSIYRIHNNYLRDMRPLAL
jgi:hypothetical protein